MYVCVCVSKWKILSVHLHGYILLWNWLGQVIRAHKNKISTTEYFYYILNKII